MAENKNKGTTPSSSSTSSRTGDHPTVTERTTSLSTDDRSTTADRSSTADRASGDRVMSTDPAGDEAAARRSMFSNGVDPDTGEQLDDTTNATPREEDLPTREAAVRLDAQAAPGDAPVVTGADADGNWRPR